MLSVCFRLAAAIHGYLAFYMPTQPSSRLAALPARPQVGDPRRPRCDADLPVRHERLRRRSSSEAALATSTCW